MIDSPLINVGLLRPWLPATSLCGRPMESHGRIARDRAPMMIGAIRPAWRYRLVVAASVISPDGSRLLVGRGSWAMRWPMATSALPALIRTVLSTLVPGICCTRAALRARSERTRSRVIRWSSGLCMVSVSFCGGSAPRKSCVRDQVDIVPGRRRARWSRRHCQSCCPAMRGRSASRSLDSSLSIGGRAMRVGRRAPDDGEHRRSLRHGHDSFPSPTPNGVGSAQCGQHTTSTIVEVKVFQHVSSADSV